MLPSPTMPRPRTGSVHQHGDHWDIRITLPGGKRAPRICLAPGLSEEQAKQEALAHTRLAEREATGLKGKASEPGESFAAWSERWLAARDERGLSSVDTDRGRLKKWILPLLGEKAVADVSREDVESLVEHLDASVVDGALAWKTALNTWGLVTKALADACGSKVKALRVRRDNPAAGVEGPDRGAKRSRCYLYPSEVLQVLASERVTLAWRRSLALSVYLYTRPGELRALRWAEDVDTARGLAHVHRSIDREGDAKTTKTGITRRVPIEPTLLPLLRAMEREAGGEGPVIELPDDRHLSRALAGILRAAGVNRAELFAHDETRARLRWYDLRSTGITWMAIRGDDPLKIMARAGHKGFATTQGYIREAEAMREGFGEVFPPLPSCLLTAEQEGQEGPVLPAKCPNSAPERGNMVEAPGIEPPRPAGEGHVSRAFVQVKPDVTPSTPTGNPAMSTPRAEPRAEPSAPPPAPAPSAPPAVPSATPAETSSAPASPMARAVAELLGQAARAAELGDVGIARRLADAARELLADPAPSAPSAPVVSLADHRRRTK